MSPAVAEPAPRFLVVGETVIDVIAAPGTPATRHVGGSPANVATGLARLGHPTGLCTCLGRDPDGQRAAAHLGAEGVELSSTPGPGATPVATAHLDPGGAASYDFAITWDPVLPAEATPGTHVHTGSLATALDPGAEASLDFYYRASRVATTSFDPNVRPGLLTDTAVLRSRVERAVACSTVVKASDEDLAHLYPGLPVDGVLEAWSALGPSLLVVTCGPEGARARHNAAQGIRRFTVPVRPGRVVDTVGAGDSFTAGLLSALADSGLLGAPRALAGATADQVQAALQRGRDCAAVTVSRAGADLPHRSELPG